MGMVPPYETTDWQVGVNEKGMVTIRVPIEGGFQDYFVPPDEGNTDYQQYLKWVAEGNTPKILIGRPSGPI